MARMRGLGPLVIINLFAGWDVTRSGTAPRCAFDFTEPWLISTKRAPNMPFSQAPNFSINILHCLYFCRGYSFLGMLARPLLVRNGYTLKTPHSSYPIAAHFPSQLDITGSRLRCLTISRPGLAPRQHGLAL
ncbi:hypothetical protein F5884DRAFT_809190 [Xylogone sp. PMI_703]|nr:hypothetical protein F5884DRAFT_809190 [Xylogone sp. PMI_703]